MKKDATDRYSSMTKSEREFIENILSSDDNWAILNYIYDNYDEKNELYLPDIAKEFDIENNEMTVRLEPLVKHGIVYKKVNTKSDLGNCEKYIYYPTQLGKKMLMK